MQAVVCLLVVVVLLLLLGIGYALVRIRHLQRVLHGLVQDSVPPSEYSQIVEAAEETCSDIQRNEVVKAGLDSERISGNGSDKELFDRIHQAIVEEKLFLNPDFSREHVIRLGLINKNKVARLFREYAHTNFSGYVNKLRLEYALHLLQEHPDTPVKAVAYDAGFNSVRTFYRIFEQVYGKTPLEYKVEISSKGMTSNGQRESNHIES